MSARVMGSDAARAVGRFRPDGPDGYRAKTAPGAPLRATRAEAVEDERAWLEDGRAPVAAWRRVRAPEGSWYPHIWHDGGKRIVRPHGAGGYVLVSFGWSTTYRPDVAYWACGETLRELFALADVARCDWHGAAAVVMTETRPGHFECPEAGKFECPGEMIRDAAAGVETLRGWLARAETAGATP